MKITEIQLAQIIRKNTLPGRFRSNTDFDAAANQINELLEPKYATFEEWKKTDTVSCSWGFDLNEMMKYAWEAARK